LGFRHVRWSEPVNLPAIGPEHHPSWTRRMQVELEALAAFRATRR
jgi:hypothetical protein